MAQYRQIHHVQLWSLLFLVEKSPRVAVDTTTNPALVQRKGQRIVAKTSTLANVQRVHSLVSTLNANRDTLRRPTYGAHEPIIPKARDACLELVTKIIKASL